MSLAITADSPQAIAARMEAQRAQLHRQFVHPPTPQVVDDPAPPVPAAGTAMQPFEPRSLVMRLLISNPQLIQRVAVLAVTTMLGARYSSWAVRLFGLALSLRSKP